MTEHRDEDAVGVRVVVRGSVLEDAVDVLEAQVVEHAHVEVQAQQRLLQVVAVGVGAVALLKAKSEKKRENTTTNKFARLKYQDLVLLGSS